MKSAFGYTLSSKLRPGMFVGRRGRYLVRMGTRIKLFGYWQPRAVQTVLLENGSTVQTQIPEGIVLSGPASVNFTLTDTK